MQTFNINGIIFRSLSKHYMKPIELLIDKTKFHLNSIGYENTKDINESFVLAGQDCMIESIIALTLITDLEESLLDELNIKFDIFEFVSYANVSNLTLGKLAYQIDTLNKII